MLRKLDREEEAKTHLQEALRLDPSDLRAEVILQDILTAQYA
jgi:hypothetical protein